MELHYDFYLGDITLIIDDHDLSTNLGWVPILDVVSCFCVILRSIRNGGKEKFKFTESESIISFETKNSN